MMNHAAEYFTDTMQKSVLFADLLRKRGNIYFEHIDAGQPPVLTFDYEIVMDGMEMDPPVNYALAHIIDRRQAVRDRRFNEKSRQESSGEQRGVGTDRRFYPFERSEAETMDPGKRPIVIIDPRAGHGPGIGGSKRNSEIGMAMDHGHPVYFILFYTHPEPGQTLSNVVDAEILFLTEVHRRHPAAEKPAVIGNCQAGWAAALIGASRPDVTGPLVFNGSPLSYWSGVDGKNPMRYKGGLCGGTWMASLWSDLGDGIFDGANLVSGFEDLNPANTLWSKQYNVYDRVDTEEKRYLTFERWWNGYFYMTGEEIHFIVQNLFMGNRLEHGFLELDDNRVVNLKNLEDPVIVFASSGDNITPPQQALNWIVKVWESVEEIKKHQQVIVYLLHETVGHLGIFVSGKVSKKEHKEIIGSIDLVEYLSPGLYEMVIVEDEEIEGDHDVRFEPRTFDDILVLDDHLDDDDFRVVAAASESSDELYRKYVSPWVRLFSSPLTAEGIRQLHPLRASRYMFSDLNPLLFPAGLMAPLIKEARLPASDANPFRAAEKTVSASITGVLNWYRDTRDLTQEFVFKSIYSNPWLAPFFPDALVEKDPLPQKQVVHTGDDYWLGEMEKGGTLEGILRIMIAMIHADDIYDRKELDLIRKLILSHNLMTEDSEPHLKHSIQKQARILQIDREMAIEALPKLIRTAESKLTALTIAEAMAHADDVLHGEEEALLARIRTLLSDRCTL